MRGAGRRSLGRLAIILGLSIPAFTLGHVVISLLGIAFGGVVQAFQKLPALHVLAQTQSAPPFLAAQSFVLIAFAVLGYLAARYFMPGAATAAKR